MEVGGTLGRLRVQQFKVLCYKQNWGIVPVHYRTKLEHALVLKCQGLLAISLVCKGEPTRTKNPAGQKTPQDKKPRRTKNPTGQKPHRTKNLAGQKHLVKT